MLSMPRPRPVVLRHARAFSRRLSALGSGVEVRRDHIKSESRVLRKRQGTMVFFRRVEDRISNRRDDVRTPGVTLRCSHFRPSLVAMLLDLIRFQAEDEDVSPSPTVRNFYIGGREFRWSGAVSIELHICPVPRCFHPVRGDLLRQSAA